MRSAILFGTYYLPPFAMFLFIALVLFALFRRPIHLFSMLISERYSAQMKLCIFIMIFSFTILFDLGSYI